MADEDLVFSADGYFTINKKTGAIAVGDKDVPSGSVMPMPTWDGKHFSWTERRIDQRYVKRTIPAWVREIQDEVYGDRYKHLRAGAIIKHPDGRTVKIIKGQWMGTYGLSNFWYWQEVLPDGALSDKVEHGYGWADESN